jgi:hypothetical protein
VAFTAAASVAISLHQGNLYPADSGAVEDTGAGAGEGTTINVPLPPGSGNGAYEAAIERVVAPAIRRFDPDIVLVAPRVEDPFIEAFRAMAYTELQPHQDAAVRRAEQSLSLVPC